MERCFGDLNSVLDVLLDAATKVAGNLGIHDLSNEATSHILMERDGSLKRYFVISSLSWPGVNRLFFCECRCSKSQAVIHNGSQT